MDGATPNWFQSLLRCPECGHNGLSEMTDQFRCVACGSEFPTSCTVPLLIRPSAYTDTAKILGHHLGGVSPADVEKVFGTALRYRLADPSLRTEFTNIVERYDTIIPELQAAGSSEADGPFVLVAEYFNPRFTAGETSYRSLRVRNISPSTWATSGPRPWNLSYFLYDADAPDVPIEGIRSALPVPLRPSQELTIPLRISAPEKPGRYRIVIKLVQEFVGWLEPALFETEIQVSTEAASRPSIVTPPHEGFFDFDGDLRQCGVVIEKAVSMLRSSGLDRKPRILEVACGNDPQVLRHYQPGTLVVACDVSMPQVQLGALKYLAAGSYGIRSEHYRFVSADVYNPPFRPGSFDLVVVCAALHHFADVKDALVRLSDLVQPNGLIVLLREPCKVFPEDETYIRELLNGFNEQQFELDEYEEIFQVTALEPYYQQVDYECSYKTMLGKQKADVRAAA